MVRADDDMMIDLANKLATMKQAAIAKQTALEQQRKEAIQLSRGTSCG
jgi:hypothetical protein